MKLDSEIIKRYEQFICRDEGRTEAWVVFNFARVMGFNWVWVFQVVGWVFHLEASKWQIC